MQKWSTTTVVYVHLVLYDVVRPGTGRCVGSSGTGLPKGASKLGGRTIPSHFVLLSSAYSPSTTGVHRAICPACCPSPELRRCLSKSPCMTLPNHPRYDSCPQQRRTRRHLHRLTAKVPATATRQRRRRRANPFRTSVYFAAAQARHFRAQRSLPHQRSQRGLPRGPPRLFARSARGHFRTTHRGKERGGGSCRGGDALVRDEGLVADQRGPWVCLELEKGACLRRRVRECSRGD